MTYFVVPCRKASQRKATDSDLPMFPRGSVSSRYDLMATIVFQSQGYLTQSPEKNECID